MIINIRGTSGSGKSTIVRHVMALYNTKARIMKPDRRQPFAYALSSPKVEGAAKMVAILGHYETSCGGCDTISKQSDIFEAVRYFDDQGMAVIFEGLLLSGEVTNTASLHKEGRELYVFGLDQVPIDLCLDSVNGRRKARLGEEKFTPVKPENTVAKFRGTQQAMARLQKEGVEVLSCDRDTALRCILGLLQMEHLPEPVAA
jgi:energy-coupling factor transporter ATP-binding protein EcfA2